MRPLSSAGRGGTPCFEFARARLSAAARSRERCPSAAAGEVQRQQTVHEGLTRPSACRQQLLCYRLVTFTSCSVELAFQFHLTHD